MYCGRCGTPIGRAANCPSCGEPAPATAGSVPPPPPPAGMGGVPPYGSPMGGAYGAPPFDVSGKKVGAGICGILLGALGIHKFVLGYTKEGLIMLLVSLLTCGVGAVVFGVIGLVEGIIYLTKSDAEFYRTYVAGRKGWF
jgi:TM2 domain-containing membrane protein YozV